MLASDPTIFVGYYPTWKRAQMQGVDLTKYTHVNIAFASPSASGAIPIDAWLNVPDTVKDIHAAGAKALLSIGGWNGSQNFSAIASSPAGSGAMAGAIIDLVEKYSLDGIDIDWEYPGRQGCETFKIDAANDTPNFLKFLRSLRAGLDAKFAAKKLITLAVYVQPFSVDGKPMADVSEFAKVVDFANMMQYDINGVWSATTGPNAPLFCETGKGTQLSFASAIDAWTAAKWPASQLTAGFAFYGRMAIAAEDMTGDGAGQYQKQTGVLERGDKDDAPWPDPCTGKTTSSGQWQWKNLRTQGVLTTPTEAAAPWVRTWDNTSMTPWLFKPQTKQFISYDDPQSIKAKADYAASKGLAGAMVWSIDMDYNSELINAVRTWPARPVSSGVAATGGHSDADDCSEDAGVGDNSSSLEDDDCVDATADHSGTNDGEDDCADTGADSSNTLEASNSSTTTSSGSNYATTNGTKPTSSAPAGSSSSPGAVATGGACPNGVLYTCDKPGVEPGYTVCVYGRSTSMQCSPGTVCIAGGSSLSCGYGKDS
ncbi:hypothetical protein H4R18_005433 [Coemansia javaensis]|uniref:GH18 domain-containing protein n=1 Tax=Coemansia javaensis TaxID=2761396 RepID=A0A9W8LFD1_9FUNG|nr:hypothetical protein H4R18_005433 [Coemansia javaensis]